MALFIEIEESEGKKCFLNFDLVFSFEPAANPKTGNTKILLANQEEFYIMTDYSELKNLLGLK